MQRCLGYSDGYISAFHLRKYPVRQLNFSGSAGRVKSSALTGGLHDDQKMKTTSPDSDESLHGHLLFKPPFPAAPRYVLFLGN